ncbi:hypothetical protein [Treponema denticola]|uniref:hypothetical protein n=1 Tax=Treponema denticola TaxID=158 RepID=UPI0020A26A06|nr:hypothetical protein [Treponema denticola]UTC83712.1 hypothetical protein HGJ18_11080 [Treponema denticola]
MKGDALAKEVDRVAAQNNLKDKNLIKVGEKLDLGKGNSREDKTKERSTDVPKRNSGKTKTEEKSSKTVRENNREDKTEEAFPRTSSEGKEKRTEAGSSTSTNKSNSNDITKTKQAAASANNKPEPTKNNLLCALTNGVNYIGSEWNKFKDNVSKAWESMWDKSGDKNKAKTKTSVPSKVEPAYFSQLQFDDVMVDGKPLFTKKFATHACNVTALLNEFSEEYTKQTGEKLDFTEAAIFTKTLVGSRKTDTIWYSEADNAWGYVQNDVGYLNALSEHFNIGTAEGKKWYHDYQKDRLSGYHPDAGTHLIYYNGGHFSNNTDTGSQIYDVMMGKMINFTNSDQKFYFFDSALPAEQRNTTKSVKETRRYLFK